MYFGDELADLAWQLAQRQIACPPGFDPWQMPETWCSPAHDRGEIPEGFRKFSRRVRQHGQTEKLHVWSSRGRPLNQCSLGCLQTVHAGAADQEDARMVFCILGHWP